VALEPLNGYNRTSRDDLENQTKPLSLKEKGN